MTGLDPLWRQCDVWDGAYNAVYCDPAKPNPIVRPESRRWCDLVRSIAKEHGRPSPSDEEVEYVLWEQTPFPLAGTDLVVPALHRFFAEVTA
jgi:hypothetical protein